MVENCIGWASHPICMRLGKCHAEAGATRRMPMWYTGGNDLKRQPTQQNIE